MKSTLYFAAILIVFLITGCMQTRYITEKYIKTNIENHNEGKYSTIKTYTVFKGPVNGGKAYLELTGYKYDNTKALVIGADRYFIARKKFKDDNTLIAKIIYIELTLDQCKAIVNNYRILQQKINAEKPRMNEEVYHDFTASDDLFISFRKSSASASVNLINLWIDGEKYVLPTNTIMKSLNKIMSY